MILASGHQEHDANDSKHSQQIQLQRSSDQKANDNQSALINASKPQLQNSQVSNSAATHIHHASQVQQALTLPAQI